MVKSECIFNILDVFSDFGIKRCKISLYIYTYIQMVCKFGSKWIKTTHVCFLNAELKDFAVCSKKVLTKMFIKHFLLLCALMSYNFFPNKT